MADIFGNRIQTTVRTDYLPYVVDTILNSNVLFQRIVRAAKKWPHGRMVEVPVKYAKNTTGTSYRGYDTFSTSATNNRVKMQFDPAFYQISVSLPGDELSVSKAAGEGAILNLIKLTIQSDTEDMADDLGTIFYADGTGNSSKDPLGLAALVDDGSSVTTIGGLNRTAGNYTTLQSTVTAAASNKLTLAQMDTMWNNVTSGSQKPTLIVTPEAVFSYYEQLVRSYEHIQTMAVGSTKGKVGDPTFTGLAYKGVPVIADEKCTSGYMYFLNENFLDWYAMPHHDVEPVSYKSQIEGNDYGAPLGLGFAWSDWIKPSNSDSVVGHIYFGGQFVCTNPKRQGVLTGITGI